MVVVLHAFQGEERTGMALWYLDVLYYVQEVICRSAVPVFFVISGYMFFCSIKEFSPSVYKTKLQRRIRSLLIPYLIWNALALLEIWIKHLPVCASLFPRAQGLNIDFLFCIQAFWSFPDGSCPIYYPFWYIRDLMVMVVLSPVFYWILKKIKVLWLVVLLVLMFLSINMPSGLSFSSMFFFSLGAYWSIFKKDVAPNRWMLGAFAVLWLPVAYMDTMTREAYWHTLSVIVGVGAILFCAELVVSLRSDKLNRNLKNSVFFIYAIHAFLISYVHKSVFAIAHPSCEAFRLLLTVVTAILTLLISYYAYKIIYRYLPTLCRVITGRR